MFERNCKWKPKTCASYLLLLFIPEAYEYEFDFLMGKEISWSSIPKPIPKIVFSLQDLMPLVWFPALNYNY